MLVLWALAACAARASEITFELPDNAKQCFYEEIAQGTKCTLEFQVPRPEGPPGRGAALGRVPEPRPGLSLRSLPAGNAWERRPGRESGWI